MTHSFEITNTTRGNPAGIGLPFNDIKNAAFGTSYELSLVFVGEKKMRTINRTYRKKDKSTNVLSFPLNKKAGEIFICPVYAKREAKHFDRTYKQHIAILYIHGLMHLKGMDHGSTMDREELKLQKKFKI